MAFEYSSVYAVSKVRSRRVDGALAPEVAPFGIHTTIVNPGFFRTRLRAPHRSCGQISIHDYAECTAEQRRWRRARDRNQAGDPDKLAGALLMIAEMDPPPRRFIAGAS